MITVDMTKNILVEEDIILRDTFCIECFSAPDRYLKYFNGHGPFCTLRCFAKYVDIPWQDLPKREKIGKIK
jgi:hypothetical protein